MIEKKLCYSDDFLKITRRRHVHQLIWDLVDVTIDQSRTRQTGSLGFELFSPNNNQEEKSFLFLIQISK